MVIIGCDFHSDFQQISWLDTETGEVKELSLRHREQARAFYVALPPGAVVGVEACGQTQWFEALLAELGHELRMGDPTKIRAAMPRRQKTDRRDAEHIRVLLTENRFPEIWVPSPAERDARQLIVHRHKRVQMRTAVKNQLHALAINQGLRLRWRLWTAAGRRQFEALPLLPYAAQRRQELLRLLDEMDRDIAVLDAAVAREAQTRPEVVRLMSHPGVGPVTALAFVLTIGPVERFARARQVASYLGLIPAEHSSAGKQRLGHISKQGSPLLRLLLVEAAHVAVQHEPELKRSYTRLRHKHAAGVAKVAVARKLATRLYWMLRTQTNYRQLRAGHMQVSPSHSVVEV